MSLYTSSRDILIRWLTVTLLLAAATMAGAAPTPLPGKRVLLFVGSNTLGERAIPELARAWLETEKKVKSPQILARGELIYVAGKLPNGSPVYVEIHATGSGDSFKSLRGAFPKANAPCDIGMSSRRINEKELAELEAAFGEIFTQRGTAPGLGNEHAVGLDGLAIVVHRSNPLARISFTELGTIFSRKVQNWSEMKEWKEFGGGEGMPIVPLRRKEPSGTLDFFRDKIKLDAAAMGDERTIPAYVSSGDLVRKVADTPGAITFVGHSYAMQAGLKRLQVYDDQEPLSMAPEEAVYPDSTVTQKGRYPLARLVFLYSRAQPKNPEVTPFLKFALSEAGQAVLADAGGLFKVEGTLHQITSKERSNSNGIRIQPSGEERKRNVILRLHGSNTVGAECAVNLVFNFLMMKRQDKHPTAVIEDLTSPIETPEGEKAQAHDVMCDLDKDGVWETIEIRPTGSSDAFKDLLHGDCDVGMSSRRISDAERRDLSPVCGNLDIPEAQFALGLDALAVIVSNDNPVDRLTVEQLRGIYLGEIKDWSEVGGEKKLVQLHSRADRSGTYKFFCDSVLHGKAVHAAAKRHAENHFVAEAVSADPAGIGFLPMAMVGVAKVLKIGHEGSTNFHKPNEEAVRAGKYPPALCRYIYLYVPATPPKNFLGPVRENWPAAREFAEMTQTWRGQAIVANSGFITDTSALDEGGQVQRLKGESITDFLDRLRELERKVQLQQTRIQPKLIDNEICPRLVFDFNDSMLTAESKNIIEKQLGSWLKMYPAAAKAGLVAEGWADSVGSDEACVAVSKKRAEQVAGFISETHGLTVRAIGRGKSFDPPNSTEENKQLNRRVAIKLAAAPAVTSAGGSAQKVVKKSAPAKSGTKRR